MNIKTKVNQLLELVEAEKIHGEAVLSILAAFCAAVKGEISHQLLAASMVCLIENAK